MYAPQAVFQPGITQPGFDQLDRSIAQMGDVFGQARKNVKAAAALREAMRGTDPETNEPNKKVWGISDDEYKSKSWADQTAFSQAAVKNVALQSAMQDQKLRQLQIQNIMQDQAGQNALPQFNSDLQTAMTDKASVNMRPMGTAPDSVLSAAVGADLGAPTPGEDPITAKFTALRQNPTLARSRSGMAILQQAMQEQEKSVASPLEQLRAATEAKRADAYTRQVDSEAARLSQPKPDASGARMDLEKFKLKTRALINARDAAQRQIVTASGNPMYTGDKKLDTDNLKAAQTALDTHLDGDEKPPVSDKAATSVVNSQADYDALPSGATYTDAAGNVRKKK